jgi:hypothetical protein
MCGCSLDVEPAKNPCASPSALKLHGPLEGIPAVAVADVTLFGELDRPSDMTVSEVSVGAVKATLELGSFDRFRVDLPLAEIMRHLLPDAPMTTAAQATLPITAETNCATPTVAVDNVTFTIPPRAAEMLDVALAMPIPLGYLPPRMSPIEIKISAAASSSGATVHLETTAGMIVGAAGGVVMLDPSGLASVQLIPDGKEGTTLITARSGDQSDSLSIPFIGAPSILPSGIPTYVDTPLDIEVNARGGRLKGCRAAAPPGVSVTSSTLPDETDLTIDDDLDSDTVATVTILATATAPIDSTVSLRCYDEYDQVTSAVYTVKAK